MDQQFDGYKKVFNKLKKNIIQFLRPKTDDNKLGGRILILFVFVLLSSLYRLSNIFPMIELMLWDGFYLDYYWFNPVMMVVIVLASSIWILKLKPGGWSIISFWSIYQALYGIYLLLDSKFWIANKDPFFGVLDEMLGIDPKATIWNTVVYTGVLVFLNSSKVKGAFNISRLQQVSTFAAGLIFTVLEILVFLIVL